VPSLIRCGLPHRRAFVDCIALFDHVIGDVVMLIPQTVSSGELTP
jgi:hypothetical protein